MRYNNSNCRLEQGLCNENVHLAVPTSIIREIVDKVEALRIQVNIVLYMTAPVTIFVWMVHLQRNGVSQNTSMWQYTAGFC